MSFATFAATSLAMSALTALLTSSETLELTSRPMSALRDPATSPLIAPVTVEETSWEALPVTPEASASFVAAPAELVSGLP